MVEYLFWTLLFFILYPLVLYPISLIIIEKFYEDEVHQIDYDFNPDISLIISAHNEEKSILSKIENSLKQDYPYNKIQIIISSDNSTDRTNFLVEQFIKENQNRNIKLIKNYIRRGKTFAQNQAVKESSGEILLFSDANSLWNEDATRYLVSRFKNSNLAYLSGRLKYINDDNNLSNQTESTYWNLDIEIRRLESKISSTVGGNGAIYAIRKNNYVELPDLLSHDGFMPTKVVLQEMDAKFEPRAIAFEKGVKSINEEYFRKVRMQRGQPWKKYYDLNKFNFLKYGWFSYFYIGHKYLKYQLYLFHIFFLIINIYLSFESLIYQIILFFHFLFYFLASLGWLLKFESKIFYLPFHYTMTIIAQVHAIYLTLLGKSSATWNKADSTR